MFPKIGLPQNGWFIMENPIRKDNLGVSLFLETLKCWKWEISTYGIHTNLRELTDLLNCSLADLFLTSFPNYSSIPGSTMVHLGLHQGITSVVRLLKKNLKYPRNQVIWLLLNQIPSVIKTETCKHAGKHYMFKF